MSKARKRVTVDLSGKPFKFEELKVALSGVGDGNVDLVLHNAEIRWADCPKIAEALDAFPLCRVLSLDVSRNAIGPEGMAALCSCKSLWNHLFDLNMTDCLIESDGAAMIGHVMRNSNLGKLDMTGNAIGSYGLGAFARFGLDGNVSLQSLVLDRNKIDDAGLTASVKAFSNHISLSVLSMAHNEIGWKGAAALTDAFQSGDQCLHTLNLSNNLLGKKGAAELSVLLQKNRTLTALDLSENTLGGSQMDSVVVLSKEQDGVVALAQSLAKNPSLLSLNLRGNRLAALATLGMKGKGQKNEFDVFGVQAFATMLTTNVCLSRLLFDNTDNVELLEPGLKKNCSIVSVGDNPPPSIASVMERNVKERNGLVEAIKKGAAVAKVKAFFDKGVDVLGIDPEFFFQVGSPDVISLVHSIASVRNHIYSSSRVLDAVNSYPAKNLKELAKHPEFIVFAVRLKNIEAVTCMLKHGADPNKLDSQERTPLHVAVELGHDEIVALLFSYRADPEIMFAGLPLALLAVSNGHANVLQLLIKKFPKMRDTKSPAPKLRSLLHVAAKSGRAQAVAVLLVLGMDPNLLSGDSFTPLHVASSPEICKLLVDAGASIRNLTPDGKDVLNQALFPVGPGSFVNLDVVTFVLENDTENFFQDPRDGANSLHQVKALDVRNQYRDNLPLWIGKLPNLESIQAVEGNNLRSIPKNALEAGDEGVLNYLKDIGAGSKDVWSGFKILVLGKEGVGKTHIFHLASGGIYDRNVSTDGIDIHRFELGKEKIPVTWFDFGGQEVFYPTHELFLTGNCVYLLAFSLDDPEYDQRVSYWLRVMNSFSHDKAKVLIIGTHKDCLANPERDVALINTRILEMTGDSTAIVNRLYISCLDPLAKMNALICDSLIAAAEQAKLGGKEVPHVYTVINEWTADQRSRENARPYFLWDEFVEAFPGYDSALLERACEFLHDMGSLFLAKRFVRDRKANLVCIDIQWLARAFSAVVTFRHSWVKDGVLHQSALSHIWRDFGIVNLQDMIAIMSLFEKFNIAFARRKEGVWVIPSMLNVESPAALGEINGDLTHARLYKMSVLPSGVFGQIIARVSDWGDVQMTSVWRFGMIVQHGRDLAVLTVEGGCEIHLTVFLQDEDPAGAKVDPSMAGSLLRRLDEELQHAFRIAFRSMAKLPVEISIMCPHCIGAGVPQDECNWLFYDDVVKMVLAGDESFVCGGQETKLAAFGEDVTMGYAKIFRDEELKLDKEPLVRGDSGALYKGILPLTGQKVVVKELQISESQEVMEWFGSFQREVSQMYRLRHPNLVQMHGIMLAPLRIVLEFCASGDLLGVLKRRQIKGRPIKMRLALDIANGMKFLHNLDPPFAHRELRSSNVLLISISAAAKDAVAKVKLADSSLTKASNTTPTWQWTAPEALFLTEGGGRVTELCDVYSFAMILWEIWAGTGEMPFESIVSSQPNKKTSDFMNAIVQQNLRPVCGSTWDITQLIEMCWEKDPNKRPSFSLCVEALTLFQKGAQDPEVLKDLLRKERSAKAAASTVSGITESDLTDSKIEDGPSMFDRETEKEPTTIVAVPKKDAGFGQSSFGYETSLGLEGLVEETFGFDTFASASFDTMMPATAQTTVSSTAVPKLQTADGVFQSGWEQEILQRAKANAAKKVQVALPAFDESSSSEFGPGWEEQILKRAAAARQASPRNFDESTSPAPSPPSARAPVAETAPSTAAPSASVLARGPRASITAARKAPRAEPAVPSARSASVSPRASDPSSKPASSSTTDEGAGGMTRTRTSVGAALPPPRPSFRETGGPPAVAGVTKKPLPAPTKPSPTPPRKSADGDSEAADATAIRRPSSGAEAAVRRPSNSSDAARAGKVSPAPIRKPRRSS